ELLSYKGFTNEEEIHVRNFLSECRSIGIDNDIKTEVIYLRRKFGNKLPDSIIAATSICMDIPLITADHDFKKIEKLQLIFYEKIK
ncbi:MAG TPA: VapC toxin family PIN domain ribonuclease, partial [Porphyromonadaceae bacterium]|nr:VapC toxin family PIN domain ribonuclease [Porphyromonadaceae bacterium]